MTMNTNTTPSDHPTSAPFVDIFSFSDDGLMAHLHALLRSVEGIVFVEVCIKDERYALVGVGYITDEEWVHGPSSPRSRRSLPHLAGRASASTTTPTTTDISFWNAPLRLLRRPAPHN